MRGPARLAAGCALALVAPLPALAAPPAPSPPPAATPAAEGAPFALSLRGGAALDNPAFFVAAGGRYLVAEAWMLGVDVEWNPWASLPAATVRPGALNLYATGLRRWDMKAESVKLRTTAHLGTSILLFDLYGAPRGSTGLFLGLSLLSLEIRVAPSVYLLLDPADVAIPAPQLRGAPLTYLQYRAAAGLQLGG